MAAAAAPQAWGILDVAERLGVSKAAVEQFLARSQREWEADQSLPRPPEWSRVNARVLVVDQADWIAWERARRAVGLLMPGDRPRGPRPRPSGE